MMVIMKGMQYNISYAPPVLVKDEPHRLLDSSDSASETVEVTSFDYGSVLVVGEITEIESGEMTPRDAATPVG
jgi:hypothetical protein